jgi:RecJ-like exonuclease
VKTYAHECPACDAEGYVDELDHARIRSYDDQTAFKRVQCETCQGAGEVELDERSHAFVSAMADDYMARRCTDRAVIAEQRQHIATLEALLRAERTRTAQLEAHLGETEVLA